MALRLSRRKMAEFVADKLVAGVPMKKALREVAAYLIETRRTREVELLVRDIEATLAARGIVVADVTSAHELGESLTKDIIARLVGAKQLQVRSAIDPSVLGGVRIETPGKRFDGTLRHTLTALKAKQL